MIEPDCLQGQEFLNKFINQYETFKQMGFKHYEILRMLGTLDYVKDFVDTPEWLVSAKKLPKGYKWSDGKKFSQKGGKNKEAETYAFLIVGEDLYIKNMLNGAYEINLISEEGENDWDRLISQKISDKRICVIKNWKNLKSHHVAYRLPLSPFFEKCIGDFWNENGGKMSMQEDNPLLEMLANKIFSQSCNEV